MKKVVIIRSNAQPVRVMKEAISLSNHGYLVNILFWDRSSNSSRVESKDGVLCTYFGLKAPYGKLSLVPYLLIWWMYEFSFLLKGNYDVIHPCCFDTLLPAVFTKLLKKNKIIYDIFDFYSETFPLNINRKLKDSIKVFELYLLKFTDGTIIVDESRISQINGAKLKNLEIIMNCPTDLSVPNRNSIKREKFTIFYGGTIAKDRGLNELIEAIKDERDVDLIVAGMGPDESLFVPIFSKIQNVEFLGWISYDSYINLILNTDVLFALYDPVIPNNLLASSNKLFESMMCKKPIIVNKETSMSYIVTEENCGVIVPYYETEKLKSAILHLKNNPSLCSKLGENGRKAFERKYSWDVMEIRLLSIYKKVLGCVE